MPVPRPPKIICTGTHCEAYRQVTGLAKSLVPLIFLKAPSYVVGPGDPVPIPEGYGEVSHEDEFSCVIGRRCTGGPEGASLGGDLRLYHLRRQHEAMDGRRESPCCPRGGSGNSLECRPLAS
ncbi:MAG: fumarylacetoacetate hydrolase family protein [Candidatus Methylomirabilales bacterium]